MSWDNILVANIGWDLSYEGNGVTSHHGYVVKHGDGAEAYNFSPEGGLFYGYVRGGSALGRFADRLWTVVFISKPSESEKLRIVGWYEQASVGCYRDRPEYARDATFPKLSNGERFAYSAIAKNAYVVPERARAGLILPPEHRIKSGGIYYASGRAMNDYPGQAADRRIMAEWIRSVLPPRRSISRIRQEEMSMIPQMPGILIDEGGDPLGFSPVGESEEHRALKEWVCKNPEFVTRDNRVPEGTAETILASADRVDATFAYGDTYWAVEVKSCRSSDNDHFRGIFQCVKYRAVAAAMEDITAHSVEAVLVTERPLTADHMILARKLRVRHLLAPVDRLPG